MERNPVVIGDCRDILRTLPEETFQACVTSPPYWRLRDYGHPGQIGMEPTPEAYVSSLVDVFSLVRRVLKKDGTLWLNLGDCYTSDEKSLKPKNLCGLPWRVALALQEDGWWLRSDIIWHKTNPMPESVTDRPTKAHEYVFLLAKSSRYFFDAKAVAESSLSPGRVVDSIGKKKANRDEVDPVRQRTLPKGKKITVADTRNTRSVWSLPTEAYDGSHWAVMPSRLAQRCILAGSRQGDSVLDPFLGTGTVGMVAERLGRRWFGCEINQKYEPLINKRTAQMGIRFVRTGE